MKKNALILIAIMIGIASLESRAGEILLRQGQEALRLSADFDRSELSVIYSKGQRNSVKILPLMRYQAIEEEVRLTQGETGLFGLPFGRVQDGARILREEEISSPFLTLSILTLTLALDVFALPADLIDGGLSNMSINKDARIMEKAAEREDFVRTVGERRFDRIKAYLGF